MIRDVIQRLKETERLLARQLEAVRGAITSLEGDTPQPTATNQNAPSTPPLREGACRDFARAEGALGEAPSRAEEIDSVRNASAAPP